MSGQRTMAIVYNPSAPPLRDCEVLAQVERMINHVNNPLGGWGTSEYHYSNLLFLNAMRVRLLSGPQYRRCFSFWWIEGGERLKIVESALSDAATTHLVWSDDMESVLCMMKQVSDSDSVLSNTDSGSSS